MGGCRGKEKKQWRWKEARPEPLTGEALKRKPDQQSCCIHFVMKRSRSSEGIQRLMFQTSWSGPICLPAISRSQLQSASSQNCHMSWSADCISACDNVTLQDLNWQMCWPGFMAIALLTERPLGLLSILHNLCHYANVFLMSSQDFGKDVPDAQLLPFAGTSLSLSRFMHWHAYGPMDQDGWPPTKTW